MFRFAHPYSFLLLAFIPLLMLYRKKRRFDPVMGVSSIGSWGRVEKSLALSIHRLLPVLKYLALALMITAMARPQWGTQQVRMSTEGINIILAVDISESMAALDFKKDARVVNRLEAVKGVVNEFVGKRNGDRIGMVVFGSEAYTQIPLTRDYQTLSAVLERLEIGAAGPSTAIGDALGISIKRLSDIDSKSNIIILLTDGRSNSGELTPETAAEIAGEKDIKIYTVGVGGKGKAPFKVNHPFWGEQVVYQQVDMDEDALVRIAKTTGGQYYRAQDTENLKRIYDTIDALEKTEVKTTIYAHHRELYFPLLMAAFVISGLWIVLVNTRFLRIP
jgi:Ca-activated chloride channel family protein